MKTSHRAVGSALRAEIGAQRQRYSYAGESASLRRRLPRVPHPFPPGADMIMLRYSLDKFLFDFSGFLPLNTSNANSTPIGHSSVFVCTPLLISATDQRVVSR